MRIIRGKKAFVSGAASGIGRALTLALAREGAALYLVDVDADKLAATATQARAHGVEVVTRTCNLCEPCEISAAVNAVLEAWGRIDLLVNNAGVAYYGPTHNMTAAQWDRLLAVNLLAPVQLIREFLPTLASQDEAHILNLCSIFGLVTQRKVTAYQTTKFGMVGLSLALRAEYSRGGLGVTALCPGLVRTAMLESAERGRPDKRLPLPPAFLMTSPEHVAARALAAIRRNKGIVVISPFARLMWWTMRLAPGLIDWLSREGWRRKGRIDVAADRRALDQWTAEHDKPERDTSTRAETARS
jgi:3-oxoacyl-[acyl-carrier protein] reductase